MSEKKFQEEMENHATFLVFDEGLILRPWGDGHDHLSGVVLINGGE